MRNNLKFLGAIFMWEIEFKERRYHQIKKAFGHVISDWIIYFILDSFNYSFFEIKSKDRLFHRNYFFYCSVDTFLLKTLPFFYNVRKKKFIKWSMIK